MGRIHGRVRSAPCPSDAPNVAFRRNLPYLGAMTTDIATARRRTSAGPAVGELVRTVARGPLDSRGRVIARVPVDTGENQTTQLDQRVLGDDVVMEISICAALGRGCTLHGTVADRT